MTDPGPLFGREDEEYRFYHEEGEMPWYDRLFNWVVDRMVNWFLGKRQ